MPPATPSAPTTNYRPTPRPVAPPPPKKNMGMQIGLGVSAVLALIGFGVAGMQMSAKSGQQKINTQHQSAGTALATALELTLAASTNTPVVWTSAWSTITKTVTDQKAQLADTQTKLATTLEEAAALQTQLTELTTAKTTTDKQVLQLKQTNEELSTQKAATDQQVASLQKEVTDTKAALAQAQSALATLAAQASATTTSTEEMAPITDGGAAVAPVEVAPANGEAAVATETVAGEEEVPLDSTTKTHEFPEGTTKLVAKLYSDSAAGIMKVELINGTQLVYRNVPPELFEAVVLAPVPDTYYRLKMLGNFPCTPDDKAAVRALNKR